MNLKPETIRIDENEKRAAINAAKSAGMTYNEFVRQGISFYTKIFSDRRVELKADASGLSIPDFVFRGIQFYSRLDPGFWQTLNDMEDIFKFDRVTILENLLILYWAQRAAFTDVFGEPPPAPEFAMTANGPRQGNELFEFLKGQFSENLRNIKVKYLERKKEAHGKDNFEIPLINRAMEKTQTTNF